MKKYVLFILIVCVVSSCKNSASDKYVCENLAVNMDVKESIEYEGDDILSLSTEYRYKMFDDQTKEEFVEELNGKLDELRNIDGVIVDVDIVNNEVIATVDIDFTVAAFNVLNDVGWEYSHYRDVYRPSVEKFLEYHQNNHIECEKQ